MFNLISSFFRDQCDDESEVQVSKISLLYSDKGGHNIIFYDGPARHVEPSSENRQSLGL
jgi:hypothetical protein